MMRIPDISTGWCPGSVKCPAEKGSDRGGHRPAVSSHQAHGRTLRKGDGERDVWHDSNFRKLAVFTEVTSVIEFYSIFRKFQNSMTFIDNRWLLFWPSSALDISTWLDLSFSHLDIIVLKPWKTAELKQPKQQPNWQKRTEKKKNLDGGETVVGTNANETVRCVTSFSVSPWVENHHGLSEGTIGCLGMGTSSSRPAREDSNKSSHSKSGFRSRFLESNNFAF